ncbi:MAG: hypothetical protein WC238_05285 [Parcubacteria group bacterium]|jgi:hypothetical protein
MKISRKLAIQILKYLNQNKEFYFPFQVVCEEYAEENKYFTEINSSEWETIDSDNKYQTFELLENLKDPYENLVELIARGFVGEIVHNLLEDEIGDLAKNYRKDWKEELWESENSEEFGFNEFIGGKAEAYEDCLEIIKRYRK